MTRRDKCNVVGRRAQTLSPSQSIHAWHVLATAVADDLSERDIPKFKDLLDAIRSATLAAKRVGSSAGFQPAVSQVSNLHPKPISPSNP